MRFAVFANNSKSKGGEYDQTGFCWPWGVGDMTAKGHHAQPWWFNVSFGDGHTSWIKIRGFGRQPGTKRSMKDCPTPDRCECMIQRGIGWQIDTQPSPLIPTHKIRTGNDATAMAQTELDGTENIWAPAN
jgi:hypothetical protein